MDIFKKHQLRIARDTLKMHCVGAYIMGGLPRGHVDAKAIIEKLTGKIITLPPECKCDNGQWH